MCVLLQIVGEGDDYVAWKNGAGKDFPQDAEITQMTKEQFLMPGLVDCHIHAPQVAQIGLGLDMPLLEWLNTYTFPLEAKFTDQEFASKVYTKVVVSISFVNIKKIYLYFNQDWTCNCTFGDILRNCTFTKQVPHFLHCKNDLFFQEATIKSGTTLASYFGTNDKDSTLILAKEALRQGQRALVGKVCLNCNSPDFYV